jgi:acyl dehydratase
VIYVKHGEPVRLAETVKARVWILDKDGKSVRSMNRIELQEGWYALPK